MRKIITILFIMIFCFNISAYSHTEEAGESEDFINYLKNVSKEDYLKTSFFSDSIYVNRAELAVMTARLFELITLYCNTYNYEEPPFIDTYIDNNNISNLYNYLDILRAHGYDFVKGEIEVSDTGRRFYYLRPLELATNEEVMVVFSRLVKSCLNIFYNEEINIDLSKELNNTELSEWAVNDINYLFKLGIISSKDISHPDENMTRDDIVDIALKIYSRIAVDMKFEQALLKKGFKCWWDEYVYGDDE